MNFRDALFTVEMVLESGYVPLLVGESGIGKTALVKRFSREQGAHLVIVDANLLKEGEIGGLPTTEEYEINIQGQAIRRKKTVYAIHAKLLEIDRVLVEEPHRKVVFFIDEINRCEHAVQQELMNIILNREINDYKLLKNVQVVAAMNPSNKYDHYAGTDYQVVDMDPAQEDRFVWIDLDSDPRSWIDWGVAREGKLLGGRPVPNIHPEVLEFISSFPEYLHMPNSQESIKSTPRSWERISDAYVLYQERQPYYPGHIFFNVIQGNVGQAIAHDFYNFLASNQNPIIKPGEVFDQGGDLPEELLKRVRKDSHSRLYLTARNCLNYLAENGEGQPENLLLFTRFLSYYPGDLRMGVMQDIKVNHEKTLYPEFMKLRPFIQGYLELYQEIS